MARTVSGNTIIVYAAIKPGAGDEEGVPGELSG